MFRGLGNLASLLRQAQQMGGRMQALNDKLKGERATGSTGGGMVQVEVNGLGEVLRVRIDPTLVARGEREMIEDLLPAAVNQAVAKANQLRLEAMQNMAQELNVPGLDAALAQLSGANDSNTTTK
jgi:DNA-binding YbaB/EbfC family protein